MEVLRTFEQSCKLLDLLERSREVLSEGEVHWEANEQEDQTDYKLDQV